MHLNLASAAPPFVGASLFLIMCLSSNFLPNPLPFLDVCTEVVGLMFLSLSLLYGIGKLCV